MFVEGAMKEWRGRGRGTEGGHRTQDYEGPRKRAGSGERPGAKGPGKGLLMWPHHGEGGNNEVGQEPMCKG